MKKTYYILALLFSFLSISCDNEESYIVLDTNSGICTFFQEEISLSSDWSIDDAIGITAYISESENVYLNSTNKQYKTTGNGLFVPATKEDEILHPLVNHFVDFIAYYPYKADVSTAYPISLSEQSNLKQIDLLYSNNAKNKTYTSGKIKFVFNHVLSKIVINTTPSGSLQMEDLHGMRVTINNVYNEGSFNFADESIKTSAPISSIIMKTTPNGSSSEAIVLPGPALGVSFTIELVNGYIYSANFPLEHQFDFGHIYTYNVTISQTGININPIEIEDWIMDDSDVKDEIADEIVYKTGDFYPNPNNPKTAIGIVYWLKPGTGGKEGKIISLDTTMKSWGDSDNRNLGTSISTGIINWTIVIENDPTLAKYPAFKWCMDKGTGWYLPSRYELHILNELWLTHGEYINSNILLISGGEPLMSDDVYLASSESRSWPTNMAETYYFSNKGWLPIYKSEEGRIRAVKEF